MTARTHRSSPGYLGRFLGAELASVHTSDGVEQGVVIVWERAVEVRGPVGRRLLPRAGVRRVHNVRGGSTDGIALDTSGGEVQVVGHDLTGLRLGLARWGVFDGFDASQVPDQPVWGGGPAWSDSAAGRDSGVVVAGPDGVWFLSRGTGGGGWSADWASVETWGPAGLKTATGHRVDGPGVARVRAVRAAVLAELSASDVGLVVPVRLGWMRVPHALAVTAGGLALVPVGFWGRWLGHSHVVEWDAVGSMHALGYGGVRVSTDRGVWRLDTELASSLVAELRRHRMAAAHRVDEAWRLKGRDELGWAVEARAGADAHRSWGRVRFDGGRMALELPSGTVSWSIADVSWWPRSSRPVSVMMDTPDGTRELRPVGGARVLHEWARRLGPPRAEAEQESGAGTRVRNRDGRPYQRRDTRIDVVLDAWLDECGGVPDTAPGRATRAVEVAMSSAVVRWTGPLRVGQEVGLAIGLGGVPIATRARVVRRVREDVWALVFLSPPGALVHRIGTRVRARERHEHARQRVEHIPLTAGG